MDDATTKAGARDGVKTGSTCMESGMADDAHLGTEPYDAEVSRTVL